MNKKKSRSNTRLFVLLLIVLILASPWVWKLMFSIGMRSLEFRFLCVALIALVIGVLYTKLNGVFWLTFLILLCLPTLAWELKNWISFEYYYALNEFHVERCDWLPEGERYRDFKSYYDFAYANGYWINRLTNHAYETIVWIIVPFTFILIDRKMKPTAHSNELLDQ